MKFFLVTFTILLLIVLTFATDTTPKPPAPGGPVQRFDCNSQPKEIQCSIGQTKRVQFDPKTGQCVLLQKGSCAGNPINSFTTLSACKHKCIIPNQKKTTPKV